MTLTDEMNRQQKVYSDLLGRTWKTEVMTWPDANQNRSVYSTTVSIFNARDQVKAVNQYSGAAPSDASSTNEAVSCPDGSCQKTTTSFDGHGRLKTKHSPEQQVDSNNPASTDHTTWNYYTNEGEGIQYEVVQGVVRAITYFPASGDERLRCSVAPKPPCPTNRLSLRS